MQSRLWPWSPRVSEWIVSERPAHRALAVIVVFTTMTAILAGVTHARPQVAASPSQALASTVTP